LGEKQDQQVRDEADDSADDINAKDVETFSLRDCLVPEQGTWIAGKHVDECESNVVRDVCPKDDVRGPECEPPDAGRYKDAKVLQQNSDFEEHDDHAPDNELYVLKLEKIRGQHGIAVVPYI
jgi:hypothetical protein